MLHGWDTISIAGDKNDSGTEPFIRVGCNI
jgi:hypothetical protein